jgi:hypothetical protein
MKAFPGNRFEGMELRDYFAAKAMQAMVEESIKRQSDPEAVASVAYMFADAMMEARVKE